MIRMSFREIFVLMWDQELIFLRRTRAGAIWIISLIVLMSVGLLGGILFQVQMQHEQRDRAEDFSGRIAYATGIEQEKASLLNRFRNPLDPYAAGNRYGSPYASMKGDPFATLALGQKDIYPDAYLITVKELEQVVGKAGIKNPVQLYQGILDVAFVVVFLLPFFVIGYTYNIRSLEKDQNRLDWLLSQGVSFSQWLLAKLSVKFVLLSLSFQACFLVLVIINGLVFGFENLFHHWALMAFLTNLYLLFWILICGFVNVLPLSSIVSSTTLCTVYVLFCMIIPGAIQFSANRSYPLPNRTEMIAAGREASIEATQSASKLMDEFFQDHPELAGDGVDLDEFMKRFFATQMAIEEKVDPILKEFDEVGELQNRHIASSLYFSPVLSLYAAFMHAGKTDFETHRDFYNQVIVFHGQWKAFFAPYLSGAKTFSRDVYSEMPVFQYRSFHNYSWFTRTLWYFLLIDGALFLLLLVRLKFTDK